MHDEDDYYDDESSEKQVEYHNSHFAGGSSESEDIEEDGQGSMYFKRACLIAYCHHNEIKAKYDSLYKENKTVSFSDFVEQQVEFLMDNPDVWNFNTDDWEISSCEYL